MLGWSAQPSFAVLLYKGAVRIKSSISSTAIITHQPLPDSFALSFSGLSNNMKETSPPETRILRWSSKSFKKYASVIEESSQKIAYTITNKRMGSYFCRQLTVFDGQSGREMGVLVTKKGFAPLKGELSLEGDSNIKVGDISRKKTGFWGFVSQ